eukprot:182040-Amorphochlora_amoeboformis.AAC.1
MSVRRLAGRIVKGLKPEYFESYNEEFVQKFLRPQKIPDSRKWRRPVLGGRQVAELRKECLVAGNAWPYEKERKPQALRVKRKGRKHLLSKPEREARIAENLVGMEERIEEIRM